MSLVLLPIKQNTLTQSLVNFLSPFRKTDRQQQQLSFPFILARFDVTFR